MTHLPTYLVARRQRLARCLCLLLILVSGPSLAGGGPLGIDHLVDYQNSGIWKRSNQTLLLDTLIGGEIAGALWEGGETRLGKTFWQSIDASAIGAVSSEALKHIFTRSRPDQSPDANLWFQGSHHYSFPSGEVTAVTAIVTPFVLEYAHDYPAVYALELLPLYDGIARVKVHAHWQSDALASFALGTGTAYFAHTRDSPLILSALPHGFLVGLHAKF